jgi:hypothetical protein
MSEPLLVDDLAGHRHDRRIVDHRGRQRRMAPGELDRERAGAATEVEQMLHPDEIGGLGEESRGS